MYISEMQKKFAKTVLLLDKMMFERVVEIYVNYDKNTCDRQSTCYQPLLTFQIWPKAEISSNSIFAGFLEK